MFQKGPGEGYGAAKAAALALNPRLKCRRCEVPGMGSFHRVYDGKIKVGQGNLARDAWTDALSKMEQDEMTDIPEFFEVQRYEPSIAQWQGVTPAWHYEEAMIRGEAFRQHNKGERYRVVPFGTGPVDFEPGETMPGTPDHECRAWDMLAKRVKARGGRTDDIVRHANGFRYYTGDQAEPVLGAGWESGTVTAEGFTTDPAAATTDVTAGGGC